MQTTQGNQVNVERRNGLRFSRDSCRGCTTLRKEWSFRNMWATSKTSHGRVDWVQAFGASRWTSFRGAPFVIYRLLLLLYAIAILVWSIIAEANDGGGTVEWLYFLTHWVVVINVVYLLGQLVCTVRTQYSYGEVSDVWIQRDMPFVERLTWVTEVLSVTGGLFVVIFYWAGINDFRYVVSAFEHGGLWLAIFIDWFLVGMQPFLILSFFWVTLLGWIYGIWTGIFYATGLVNEEGQRYIYNVVRWGTNPGYTAFWVIVAPLVIVFVLQCLLWLLNFFRNQAIYVVDGEGSVSRPSSKGMTSSSRLPTNPQAVVAQPQSDAIPTATVAEPSYV